MVPRSHRPLPPGGIALTALFGASGLLHLLRPRVFEGIIPTPLRRHRRLLVLGSGVAELACAAGMVHPATRTPAGLASAGLLVAVFPANVQMSLTLGRRASRRRTVRAWTGFAVSLTRLPVQVPLIRAALGVGGR